MPHDHPIPFSKRTIAQEKVMLNKKNNYFYLQRGIDRTPRGSEVTIRSLGNSVQSLYGKVKGTEDYALQCGTQCIAFSRDPDDLILFAIEHEWTMDHPLYQQLVKE
jgi:hypothetical protein